MVIKVLWSILKGSELYEILIYKIKTPFNRQSVDFVVDVHDWLQIFIFSPGCRGWLRVLCQTSTGDVIFCSQLLWRVWQCWLHDERRRNFDVFLSGKITQTLILNCVYIYTISMCCLNILPVTTILCMYLFVVLHRIIIMMASCTHYFYFSN